VTDRSGEFSLFAAGPLHLSAPGYLPAHWSGGKDPIRLAKAGILLLAVTDATNKQPVTATRITIETAPDGRWPRLLRPNVPILCRSPVGIFRLQDLIPGDYRLLVEAAGFRPERITVRVGPKTRKNLSLRRGIAISGRVVAEHSGKPIPMARVYSLPLAELDVCRMKAVDAVTDAEGRFTAEGLRSVPQGVTVIHPDFAPAVRIPKRLEPTIFRLVAGARLTVLLEPPTEKLAVRITSLHAPPESRLILHRFLRCRSHLQELARSIEYQAASGIVTPFLSNIPDSLPQDWPSPLAIMAIRGHQVDETGIH